jgi:hypothetical protein
MRIDEFNQKYEKQKEKGFYGLDIDIPEVIEFLDELFENVFLWVPGFEYAQIKLKFGRARFYSSLPYKVNHMVEQEINRIVDSLEKSDVD